VQSVELRLPPWSVAIASLLLYAAAVLQVIYAAMVAAAARAWDRAWESLDTSGDFSAEAGTVIVVSVAWIGLAVVLAAQTTWLRSASRASWIAVSVLGATLVCGNLCGSRVLGPRDPNRADSERLQRAVDEFVPLWYRVVPVWLLAAMAALMIIIGLGLLLTPSSRRYFTVRTVSGSRGTPP